MSNYYFANDHEEGSAFLSSYIKCTYKTWKSKHSLNVGKYVATFCDNGEGFIKFNKWMHETIIESIQKEYSNLEHEQKNCMLNDFMTSLNLLNVYRYFV